MRPRSDAASADAGPCRRPYRRRCRRVKRRRLCCAQCQAPADLLERRQRHGVLSLASFHRCATRCRRPRPGLAAGSGRQGRQTSVKILGAVPRADHKGNVRTGGPQSRRRRQRLACALDHPPVQWRLAAAEGFKLGDRAAVPPEDQEIRGSEGFPPLRAKLIDIEMNDADGR